jgi:hypothetical protein
MEGRGVICSTSSQTFGIRRRGKNPTARLFQDADLTAPPPRTGRCAECRSLARHHHKHQSNHAVSSGRRLCRLCTVWNGSGPHSSFGRRLDTSPSRSGGSSAAASSMQFSRYSWRVTQPHAMSSDPPTLPIQFLVTAVSACLPGNHRRPVVGACDDGGYCLFGLRLPQARLFADIAWSTNAVAATTRARAAEPGLDLVKLPPGCDIVDAAELEQWMRGTCGCDATWTRRAVRTPGLETFTFSPCAT